jgi:O-acetyl-ADP-ribose deacetylase (regulator of RNase III)
MPLDIIRNDITKVHADAIVNAANTELMQGGGVCGAIFAAAGADRLREECAKIGGCEVGHAVITPGFDLPAKYIIHTVGPVWHGGKHGEDRKLADCYTNALKLAAAHNLESVAFPLISSGIFGYPKDRALQVAIAAIGSFLFEHDMTVYLVVYDKAAFVLSEKLYNSVQEYIDDRYVDTRMARTSRRIDRLQRADKSVDQMMVFNQVAPAAFSEKRSLEDLPKQLEETFSQALLRLIDEKGRTDAVVYKRANIDKKHFSKIRSDVHYRPGKQTAVALAIALELNLDETKDLLLRAGFALSHSNLFDLIVEYFIVEGNHNIFEINETLFAFNQQMMGV